MRCGVGLGLTLAVVGDAALAAPVWAEAARAVLVGTYVWHLDDPRFGGFSGVEVAADGTTFLALSDSAAVVAGRLERNAVGAIVGVDAGPVTQLRDTTGTPLLDPMDDAEGLALLPDGSFFVSFEMVNRISRYSDLDATAVVHSDTPRKLIYDDNSAVEALAVDEVGGLYALPERVEWRANSFPLWRHDGTAWRPAFHILRDGYWLPVGADFGPDGKLYLLERDFWGFVGFMTRVRRFSLEGAAPLTGETLLETRAGRHDNLEGISVWRDAEGEIRLSMISDDNFMPLQRTEIVEYRIMD